MTTTSMQGLIGSLTPAPAARPIRPADGTLPFRQHARMAGDDDTELGAVDRPLGRVNTGHDLVAVTERIDAVTSHFWITSMPMSEQPRAHSPTQPRRAARCRRAAARARPAQGIAGPRCSCIGTRRLDTFRSGGIIAVSTPCETRWHAPYAPVAADRSCSVWANSITPLGENMMLKFRSWLMILVKTERDNLIDRGGRRPAGNWSG